MNMIAVDIPYPEVNGLLEDRRSASIIYSAFIGAHSELNAIIQYVYQEFEYTSQKKDEIAKTLTGISMCEMKHFHLLGETLKALKADSIFTDFPQYVRPSRFYRETVCEKGLEKMLYDDIALEMQTIERYRYMLEKLTNEQVINIIERIILDEELHLKVLKGLIYSK